MRSIRRFFKRLRAWATVEQDEVRLQTEIQEYLAQQTAEKSARRDGASWGT